MKYPVACFFACPQLVPAPHDEAPCHGHVGFCLDFSRNQSSLTRDARTSRPPTHTNVNGRDVQRNHLEEIDRRRTRSINIIIRLSWCCFRVRRVGFGFRSVGSEIELTFANGLGEDQKNVYHRRWPDEELRKTWDHGPVVGVAGSARAPPHAYPASPA